MGGNKIGVLGGIGPEASAEFYNKLINKLQESNLIKTNKDYPQIIINSIPAQELIFDKIKEKDLEFYKKGLKELDSLKPDFIIMVCNTIHLYYDILQKEISTPILDLRKLVKEYLEENKIKSVLIIGTPNTIKQGLYKFKEIKTFEPNKKELKQLTNAIFNYNKGIEKNLQSKVVKEICNKYIQKGAQFILLGCTEFALMLEKENLPKISTIDILVESTIKKSFK
ncbi:aspartate/glutamate racemase family protein [Candidatus Woesearchaeota archaeon]|nr:aspartate/glutamate racemase family protein [Candidatus Woesearchaeota archaeon]